MHVLTKGDTSDPVTLSSEVMKTASVLEVQNAATSDPAPGDPFIFNSMGQKLFNSSFFTFDEESNSLILSCLSCPINSDLKIGDSSSFLKVGESFN
jgi:hypothetical protein